MNHRQVDTALAFELNYTFATKLHLRARFAIQATVIPAMLTNRL